MTKIIDEDIIRQHPVSDAYREGWERTFGDTPHAEPADKCTDAIEMLYYCSTCRGYVKATDMQHPEHKGHLLTAVTGE